MNAKGTYLIYIWVLFLLLGMGGCHHHDDDPVPALPGMPGDTLARTVVIYAVAENSLTNYIAEDSLEMAMGLDSIPDGVRVVLYMDDRRSSRLCVGTRQSPFTLVRTYDENIPSTDSLGMSRVLSDIYSTYPARSYGLVLWSHGSGWVFPDASLSARAVKRRSFGIDNGQRTSSNKGPQMSIPTLAGVLRHFPRQDVILFDACFMQGVEGAYELRDVANYVVGSPAEIPGWGAPYHLCMKPLCQVPADVVGLVDAYADYYDTGGGHSTYGGTVLSAVRTSQLDALAEATRPHLMRLLGGHAALDCTDVQRYNPSDRMLTYTEYYDLGSLLYHHLQEADYAAWRSVAEQTVTYCRVSPVWYSAIADYAGLQRVTDAAHCLALSAFVPDERYEQCGWLEDYRSLSWYEAAGLNETNW